MAIESLINEAIDEYGAEEALDVLDKNKDALEQSERAKVQTFIDGVRPQIKGVFVEELEEGVGGQFSSKGIAIAEETLKVHTSIADTIAQLQETGEHEAYHEDHDHLAPMTAGDSAEGDIVVTVGGEAMTEEEAIEGLTVHQTGDVFVSDEYKGFKRKLVRGLGRAGLTIGQFEKAVDQKDLRLIDDHSRKMNV